MSLTKPPVLPAWAETGDKTQPSTPEISTGWPLSNIPPSRQRFNWLLNFLANGVRYLTRRGMPEWGNDENYMIGDRVQGPDGKTYISLVDDNLNKTPATNPTKWTRWGHTAAEVDQRIIDHVALTDPHTQYINQPELDTAFSAHLAATDPHPVYLTQDEGDGRYARSVGSVWLQRQLVTATGNFTVPANVYKLRAYAIGPGANGTAGVMNGASGNGGSGGGAAWGEIAVTPGQVIAITIDATKAQFGALPYLNATAGVGRTAPGTGTKDVSVTNGGTATGGNGGTGWNAAGSGGGGGGASGSPLGAGGNGGSAIGSGSNSACGGGGWGGDGTVNYGAGTGGSAGSGVGGPSASGGVMSNNYAPGRTQFTSYSDPLLAPCNSAIQQMQYASADGTGGHGGNLQLTPGYGGGAGPRAESYSTGSKDGHSIFGGGAGGGYYDSARPGGTAGYGGGGGGGSSSASAGGAAGTGGPGCIAIFW